jgi:hypothetical protein
VIEDAVEKNQVLHHEDLQDRIVTLNVYKWNDHLLMASELISMLGLKWNDHLLMASELISMLGLT